MLHDYNNLDEATYNQGKFDAVCPYSRLWARSPPDGKLTLAKGLNASLMFQDKERCRKLKVLENIDVFPDRQVVAMTAMEPTTLPL